MVNISPTTQTKEIQWWERVRATTSEQCFTTKQKIVSDYVTLAIHRNMVQYKLLSSKLTEVVLLEIVHAIKIKSMPHNWTT